MAKKHAAKAVQPKKEKDDAMHFEIDLAHHKMDEDELEAYMKCLHRKGGSHKVGKGRGSYSRKHGKKVGLDE